MSKTQKLGKSLSTTALALIACVVLAIAVVVYLYEGQKPASNIHPISAEQERGLQIMATKMDSCLTGESRNATMNALTGIKAGKVDISAGLSMSKVLGAIDYKDESIRADVEREIRACIDKVWPAVEACMKGDCSANDAPSTIEFYVKYPKRDGENLIKDKLRIGFAKKAMSNRPLLILDPQCNCFQYTMGLPRVDEQLNTSLFNVVGEAYLASDDSKTTFCLTRARKLPLKEQPATTWQCNLQTCTHDGLSAPWFESCGSDTNGVTNAFNPGFSLFSSAYAQAGQNFSPWHIPSLDTLRSKDDYKGVGHSEFIIQTDSPPELDADGYYLDLFVNERPVFIDGTPGSFSVSEFSPGQALKLEFGLQNMDFAGWDSGCDNLRAKVHFVKDGEKLADSVELSRQYVALRHARSVQQNRSGGQWHWQGKYFPAPNEYEYEVFLASVEDRSLTMGNFEQDENKSALDTLKQRANQLKQNFDALKVEFKSQQLIAVIRPPLSKVSYGIATGIVRPTGQVAFLFSKEEAYELLDHMKQGRKEGSGAYKRAVRDDIFPYRISGNTTESDVSSFYGCKTS